MSVAFDAAGTVNTSITFGSVSKSDTSLTIGSGLSRALLVFVQLRGSVLANVASVTWDSTGSPQALTRITSYTNETDFSKAITIELWGLVNPTSGNKTLTVTWSSTSQTAGAILGISFTGADQTGGTTTFANATTATDFSGASTTSSVTVSSAVGNLVVAQHLLNTGSAQFSSVNNTEIFLDTLAAANRAAGAAS